MRGHSRRIALAVGFAIVGTILLSGPGTGCFSFIGESVLTSADFCFIFDCQNGLFGGVLDPCSEAAGGPTFADCPNYVAP